MGSVFSLSTSTNFDIYLIHWTTYIPISHKRWEGWLNLTMKCATTENKENVCLKRLQEFVGGWTNAMRVPRQQWHYGDNVAHEFNRIVVS